MTYVTMLTYLREWLFPRSSITPSPTYVHKKQQDASTLRVVKMWHTKTFGPQSTLHLGPIIYPEENNYQSSRYVTYESPTHIVRVVYPQTMTEIDEARSMGVVCVDDRKTITS
jgi:hypothetical protein